MDKFLQIARLIKQRKYANQACDRGYIIVNGRRAKPSQEIKPGDRITLDLPGGRTEIEVLEIPRGKSVSRDEATGLYRVISGGEDSQ